MALQDKKIMPPPWLAHREIERYSIGWRMGHGEDYIPRQGGIGSNEGNGMIEYIKLFWEDAPEGEPSVILYEVDTENERLALRSIDIFADGRTRNIPDAIEITPIPLWRN